MAANTNPIYSLTAAISGIALTAANTRSDGNGTIATDIFKVFEAGAEGSFVSKVRLSLTSTVAATASTGTVIRLYISSVTSGATTIANTFLFAEVGAASQSADNSTIPTAPLEVPINFALPANYTILATTHAAPAANTAWVALAIGGNY